MPKVLRFAGAKAEATTFPGTKDPCVRLWVASPHQGGREVMLAKAAQFALTPDDAEALAKTLLRAALQARGETAH
jgi:hypothetical protein